MLTRVLFTAFVSFAATALAIAEPKPYKLGTISLRDDNFGLFKRQQGYQPTFHPCGSGDTCAEACGPGSFQCTSDDSETHCFTPANQTCCPNLSGHACDTGYYCTQDSNDETWCCPDGMDLVTCAAQYQVSALVSLSGSAAATTAAASSTAAASITITTSTITTPLSINTQTTPSTTTTPAVTPGPATSPVTSANYTVATTASPTISPFKGAASTHNAFGLESALAMGLTALIAAFAL